MDLGDFCSFCSCFCFGPFLSPKQTCSKGFMCVFSSLEFDHKYTVAFDKSDLTDRELGNTVSSLDGWIGKWGGGSAQKQMSTPACKPPFCFMLSLLKWLWLFGLDTYCKVELSECICSVSNLDIEITFAAAWKKSFKMWYRKNYCLITTLLVSDLVYQQLLARRILFCVTVCGHDSQTHLSVLRQFCLKQREQGLSQDCTLIFLQADSPGGILEMAVGNLPVSLCWHWVSHALPYYSLSRNRAFHLCNSGRFISCLHNDHLSIEKPRPREIYAHILPAGEWQSPWIWALIESSPATCLKNSQLLDCRVHVSCRRCRARARPLDPIIIGNSWLYISEFKRVKNTRFCFIKVAALLSNTFPFDFHSRQFCVGMLERKPLTFRNAGCSSDGLIEISITGSKLKQ